MPETGLIPSQSKRSYSEAIMIYKKIDISQAVFFNVSEDAAKELIDHRLNLKKPLTQRAFERALKKAFECESLGVTPDEAIEITVDNGWQGVTPEYIAAGQSRKIQAARESASTNSTRDLTLIESLTDRSWAH
jgi:hypothetical protein